jgi:hypothetical protein
MIEYDLYIVFECISINFISISIVFVMYQIFEFKWSEKYYIAGLCINTKKLVFENIDEYVGIRNILYYLVGLLVFVECYIIIYS